MTNRPDQFSLMKHPKTQTSQGYLEDDCEEQLDVYVKIKVKIKVIIQSEQRFIFVQSK